MPSAGAASAAGAGAAGAGAGRRGRRRRQAPGRGPARERSAAGAGAGSGSGAGSAGASAAGAGADPASPTTAITVPTSTVSPSGTRISVSTPDTGEGTSESTLSVETSKRTSSSAMVSPTCLNHLVMVPSVTDSPSWGSWISAMGRGSSGCGGRRSNGRAPVVAPLWDWGVGGRSRAGSPAQPCRERPVSASTLSPKSSERVGWGWMNWATSSALASQLTAR